MGSIKVAVCDDEKEALVVIVGAIRQCTQGQGLSAMIETFTSPMRLEKKMREEMYDLLFLDIDMPECDGISVAQKCRAINREAEIIFVSSREERVFDAFSVNPFGFVRKNHFISDIAAAIKLYAEKMSGQSYAAERVALPSHKGTVQLVISQISYIEGSGVYQEVHLAQGEPLVEVCSRMAALEEQLEPFGFLRIHKGYLVNYAAIWRIDTETLTLNDGTTLPISRRQRAQTKQRYLMICREKGILR